MVVLTFALKAKCIFSEYIIVCNTAQENVMNAHGETRLFLVVVNQPKNITAISTRQTIT
jgi:hypothetical protein